MVDKKSNGHLWVDRPGTIIRPPQGNAGGGLYIVTCACGWRREVKTRNEARAVYLTHRSTASWRCSQCGETDPGRRAKSADTTKCKTCVTLHTQQWAAENRERYEHHQRAFDLRTKYGITLENYEDLLVAQLGRCAICQTDDPPIRSGAKIHWHVDHCHVTGRVRGLLCFRCNQGLGLLGDDPERLRQAIAYLER